MQNKLISVLKCTAAVANVLSDEGIKAPCPIVLHTTERVSEVVQSISNYKSKVFTSNDSIDEILLELTQYGVDPVLYHYDGSFRAESRLNKICGATRTGQYKGMDVVRLPIIITDYCLTDEINTQVFSIELETLCSIEEDLYQKINCDSLSLVKDKLSELEDNMSDMAYFLKSGWCFMYPYYKQNNLLEEYMKGQESVAFFDELNEQYKDHHGISAQFIQELYKFMDDNTQVKLHLLPHVSETVSESSISDMYYDTKYLYITDKLFKEITRGFKRIVGTNTLKSILTCDNVLIKSNPKTYTSRMLVIYASGEMHRPCALRFSLEALKDTGGTRFEIYYGGDR